MAKANAEVILAARNVEKAEENAQIIREKTGNLKVSVQYMDLCQLDSVRAFAQAYLDSGKPLHTLINNAGVMALKDRSVTADGNELQFQTNYLGHFLLTHLLLPVLKKSEPSRVVCLSSIAHIMPIATVHLKDLNLTKTYSPWKAYCQSKLACLLFAYEMSRRLKGTKVTINAVHPGIVKTNLWDTYSAYTMFKGFFYNLFQKWFMIPPEDGAKTQIYVATCKECETTTGKYYQSCHKSISLNINSYRSSVQRKLYEKSLEMVGLEKGVVPEEDAEKEKSNTLKKNE